MNSAEIAKQMVEYSKGNLHDISHFLKVYAYATIIGAGENLDGEAQLTLETAALVHDIACPLCREKYGNTDGPHQEKEGAVLAEQFLRDAGCPEPLIRRVVFLVGHHHTLKGIDGIDYQILIEADYLVNADESGYSKENIRTMMGRVFRTRTGIALLKSVYQLE